MTDHERSAEAALAALDAPGLRAVRVLYPDLHGVARGKDIPLRHFPGMAEEGVTFCAAVMGTDLRHTPVVGGEEGYVDLSVRPDLQTLRVVPWQPEVAWCLGEARTLDGAEPWPVCPRSLLRSVVEAYAERELEPVVAPELEFFLVERDDGGTGRHPPVRRRALAGLHRRLGLGPARHRAQDAPLVRRARPRGVRREPRVHELAVRDQRQALGRTRRRRPGVHAQGGGEGDRRPRGSSRDVHGAAVRRPGRLGVPSPSLAGRRPGAERVRRRGRPGRSQPTRRELHRGRARARAGSAGAPRARRSTRTSGSFPTASRPRTRTGVTTTAPPSAASPWSAGRAPGSRSGPATAPRTPT